MIRQAVRHIAWAVLGLSLVAWGASYLRIDWVAVPGGCLLGRVCCHDLTGIDGVCPERGREVTEAEKQ